MSEKTPVRFEYPPYMTPEAAKFIYEDQVRRGYVPADAARDAEENGMIFVRMTEEEWTAKQIEERKRLTGS